MSQSSIAVFDLDGTLVDSVHDLAWALNTLFVQEGYPPVDSDVIRPFVGEGALALLKKHFESHGHTPSTEAFKELHKRFLSLYEGVIAQRSKTMVGVEEALDDLKEMGWILAVCTNKLTAHARILLHHLSLEHYFSAVCGRDSVQTCKPHPEHLIHTIAAAQGNLKHAVMIGDSLVDIDTARAAGIPIIAVSFGYSPESLERYNPDAFVHHFTDIPRTIQRLASLEQNT
jgi:phosphoglycolate phosphatase